MRAALQLLGHENVSGIGVVNDEAALVANFSIADLRVRAVPMQVVACLSSGAYVFNNMYLRRGTDVKA